MGEAVLRPEAVVLTPALARVYRVSILGLLLAVLLPGYARAYVAGNVINVQAWASVGLLVLLGAHFLFRERKSVYILALVAMFIAAGFLGYVIGGDSEAVRLHAFSFAPFIIASLLLELGVGFSYRPALVWLSVCAAIGAVSANYIHWFRPDVLGLLLKEEEDIKGVISLGRVGWSGYIITLPLVTQLGFLDKFNGAQRRLIVPSVVVVVIGGLLTFNRTLLVGLVCLFGYFLFRRRFRFGLKGTAIALAIGGVVGYFVRLWTQINPKLIHLISYRIIFFFAGSSQVGGDVSTRQILYGDYIARLQHSLFLGQGLGVPVSSSLGNAYWADVTLVSFAVPFGIFGVALFLAFLRKLYRRIRRDIPDVRIRRLFTVVFVLAIAISLNDDIWSHKFFVVYFVYLVNAFCAERVIEARA